PMAAYQKGTPMPKVIKRTVKAALFLTLLTLLCLLASCRKGQQQARVEPRPQRIVSLSPSVTEILYGIGAWPEVIAVSQFCTYPWDVKNKHRVNGWDKKNLDKELVLQLDFVRGVVAQTSILLDKLVYTRHLLLIV